MWLKSIALESASHIPPKRVKLACKRKVWIYSPQVKYLSVMQTVYILSVMQQRASYMHIVTVVLYHSFK